MQEKKIEFSLESYRIIRMRIMSDIGAVFVHLYIHNTHTPSIVFVYSHLKKTKLLFIPVRCCRFLQHKCVRRVLVNKQMNPQHELKSQDSYYGHLKEGKKI